MPVNYGADIMLPATGQTAFPILCVLSVFGTVLTALHFLGGIEAGAAIPTATLISFTLLPAAAALTAGKKDIFSPLQLVAGYFFLYYGARAAYLQLNPHALRLGVLAYDDYLPEAVWLGALAFGAFAGGYTLARSEAPAKYVLRICPKLPPTVPLIRIAALAAIGVLAHLSILSYGVIVGRTYTQSGMKEMGENPIPGWLPPCSGLVEIAFCLATIYALSSDVRRSERRLCKGLALTCFGLTVFKTLSQGIREYVLLALALWAFAYHYQRRPVGLGVLGVVAASGFILFPTIELFRGTLIQTTGGTPQTFEEVSDLVNYSIDYFRSISVKDFANLGLTSVFDRSQGIDALSLVVKYTPERSPWGMGSSYIDIPVQLFVPRALWADKPILNRHQEFERTYMGIQFVAQASPHVFADFYSNFAVFGLVAGAVGFGMAFKYFYLVLKHSSGRKEVLLLYCYLILSGFHQLEAEFVSGTVIMVRAVVMVVFTLWFLCVGQPRHVSNEDRECNSLRECRV
jgi:hypothetical protein